VNVTVQNKQKTVITDAAGKFSIAGVNGDVLVFSAVGYESTSVKINGATIKVQLREAIKTLDEIVSIGYQKVRKSDITGAIASVKAREMNLSTPTLSQALVGKVAGVQISQVSGAPYSGTKIRVRGTGSINASSEPLYVIDGYAIGGNISQG
jgi:hypothetical protein